MNIYPYWIDLNFVSIWSFQHYMPVYSPKDIKRKFCLYFILFILNYKKIIIWKFYSQYCLIYWAIFSRIAQLSEHYRRRINSFNIDIQEGQCWSCNWECLYCDSSQDIQWNIAWALEKSIGLRPRDFPRAPAIFHRISLLLSQ